MHTTSRNLRRLVLAALVAALLSACSPRPSITYIPDGGSYTTEEALAAGRSVDVGTAAGLDAEDAPAARERVLASLRSRDDGAADFASLMTRTFPAETPSVPVYAEAATVDGEAAWIVVEAWGGRSGKLDGRRIWVIGAETGEIVSSATGD